MREPDFKETIQLIVTNTVTRDPLRLASEQGEQCIVRVKTAVHRR